MGRIKKTAEKRHEATRSKYIQEFIKTALSLPLYQLPTHLRTFPAHWPFPRGDLYHWIEVLDRFDHILELFTKEYGLANGPQTQPFERRLVQEGDQDDNTPQPDAEYNQHVQEDDVSLVESVLNFTKVLLEKCGNRSLYASTAQLNSLLNTTSLPLLKLTLKVCLQVARRYHASRQRITSSSHLHALQASNYALNFDKLEKLAAPFKKYVAPTTSSPMPFSKGKEDTGIESPLNTSDLVAIVKDNTSSSRNWNELIGVSISHCYGSSNGSVVKPASNNDASMGGSPSTPTPVRRTSNLAQTQQTPRPVPTQSSTDMPETPGIIRQSETARSFGPTTFEISPSFLARHSPSDAIKRSLAECPPEKQYDALHRIRVASAFKSGKQAREDVVAIRLLAVSNVAYAYQDAEFSQKIAQPDSEEPKRFQLAQQLTELVQPANEHQSPVSLELQTLALTTLEALCKSKLKALDVWSALNVEVNHGVLFYILRAMIAELAHETEVPGEEAWRDAVFSLLASLLSSLQHFNSSTGNNLVSAGLMNILVEALRLRSSKAEPFHCQIVTFLDTFVNQLRGAFQAFIAAKGLDATAELAAHEVQRAAKGIQEGQTFPAEFRTFYTDYQIPFDQQQNLRSIFKFTTHMFQHAGGAADRNLRNFVETPQVLGALRTVIENAAIFGSNVWSAAVSILSGFIHNEPTSYQVVAEAGLDRAFLEAIVQHPVPEVSPSDAMLVASSADLEKGILPVSETMREIPHAFGAICLNETGMKLFLASGALERFFKIFTSTAHVNGLDNDGDLASSLGSNFDELARHHPPLKDKILQNVHQMIADVVTKCDDVAVVQRQGALLHTQRENGIPIAGNVRAMRRITVEEHEHAMATNQSNYAEMLPPDPEHDDYGGGYGQSECVHAPKYYISVACKFLSGFLANNNICSTFLEQGGAERVLDLATAPSNPHDFLITSFAAELSRVVELLVEQKPHLVLPSLLRRTQYALHQLKPMIEHRDLSLAGPDENGSEPYFYNMTHPEGDSRDAGVSWTNAVYTVRSLVMVNTLTRLISDSLSVHSHSHHRTIPTNPFSSVNLTDIYIDLVDSLGKLHAACIWEELHMRKTMPEAWIESARATGLRLGLQEADEILGITQPVRRQSQTLASYTAPDGSATGSAANNILNEDQVSAKYSKQGAPYRNTEMLCYLLGQIPMAIHRFSKSLGRALLAKRSLSSEQKQNAFAVADHMAKSMMWQMDLPAPNFAGPVEKLAYEFITVSAVVQVMADPSSSMRAQTDTLTLILSKFIAQGGLSKFDALLRTYCELADEEVLSHPNNAYLTEVSAAARLANSGMKLILGFYAVIVNAKMISETQQSVAMHGTRGDRNPERADSFHPAQCLVEIRNSVLPAVSRIWTSFASKKYFPHIIKAVLDILRLIMEAEGETGAFRRASRPAKWIIPRPIKWAPRVPEYVRLLEETYGKDLALEALFRCGDLLQAAKEYCALRKASSSPPRLPPPEDAVANESEVKQDLQSRPRPVTPSSLRFAPATRPTSVPSPDDHVPSVTMEDADTTRESTDEAVERPVATDVIAAAGDTGSSSQNHARTSVGEEPPEENLHEIVDNFINRGAVSIQDLLNESTLELLARVQPRNGTSTNAVHPPADEITYPVIATIEDLDEQRSELQKGLIDQCIDLLSDYVDIHKKEGSITFEVADLISAAVANSTEPASMRSNVGETLVQSLVSLQMEEDFRPQGMKIAAYANLLALLLQEPQFYAVMLEELKETFGTFLGFIKIFPDQKPDEPSPWIGQILLIVERLLAEDEQPRLIEWKQPKEDGPLQDQPTAQLADPIVDADQKSTLFDTLVEILPRVNKDESLALSIVRALVILTRDRKLALRLGERRNLQRLFVMIKQLAGITKDRLQSSFLLVLRHIVEDEETLRHIMRSEIQLAFEQSRSARPMDTTSYTRNLSHLVLRNPGIFVEVTNEKVKLLRWDPRNGPQTLALKQSEKPGEQDKQHDDSKAEDNVERDAQGPLEAVPPKLPEVKEMKPPAVDNPDGVIHYLLCELLTYKDVEDKDSSAPKTGLLKSPSDDLSQDAEMSDAVPTAGLPSSPGATPETKKPEKQMFKSDEHPIYIYRCFILQCLTELLACYNRTKIEFINFSRKADPQAATPSKPRSGILTYLLNNLIPVGSLNHPDDIAGKKKAQTSNWAISVVVSLCAKTPEQRDVQNNAYGWPIPQDEPELTYVRKFVLEHALRAYKDAITSSESQDQRYSRLLTLSDLFNRMLTGKPNSGNNSAGVDLLIASQRHLGKLMYEKNFIHALTSSIAEIDLNYPGAKRAVKYILRPLKWLTDTVVSLSEASEISTSAPGTTDEEEIASATSVSDDEQDREETPDLFRNSTLGMFEPGHEEDSESDSEDEDDGDIYGDDYDEEMDYEEEAPDTGDVVSDEDEDIEGMGDIEGVPGDVNMDLEIVMDDDEDDSDEDDEAEDDEDDGQDEIEILDEVTGDEENASMGEQDEGDWEDAEGAEEYEEADDMENGDSPHGGPLDHLTRVIEGDDVSEVLDQLDRLDEQNNDRMANLIEMDVDANEYFEDEMAPGEEGNDAAVVDASAHANVTGEEEEAQEEGDLIYEPELEGMLESMNRLELALERLVSAFEPFTNILADDEDADDDHDNWAWDNPLSLPPGRGGHHHHRGNPWTMTFGGAGVDRFGRKSHIMQTQGPIDADNFSPFLPITSNSRTTSR
ncbi:E3 ubiquitin-protein ligase tom1 [Elasticomyces elasticus]|nr:E3 ubiquitin-protein ligase tom1 [Elasticomyces elasticus]